MPFEIFALPAILCLLLGVWRGVQASRNAQLPPAPPAAPPRRR